MNGEMQYSVVIWRYNLKLLNYDEKEESPFLRQYTLGNIEF